VIEEAPLRRLAFIVEYDGTAYRGSQWQPGRAAGPGGAGIKEVRTIQGELEEAVAGLTGQRARVALAGRTDAGVNAQGQVCSFLTRAPYPLVAFIRALNARLPPDIAVKAGAEIPLEFDVRRRAKSRVYRYTIYNGRYQSPLWRRFAWHVATPLALEAMREAAGALLGGHDFAAFAPHLPRGSHRRTVLRAEVGRCGRRVLITMEADAFLPQQVRRTAGALVQVGLGRLTAAEFAALVDAGRPNLAGPVAPAQGLCLVRVNYEGISWEL